jgi:glucose-6-phosphate isomerase
MWKIQHASHKVDSSVLSQTQDHLQRLYAEKRSGFFDLELLKQGHHEAQKMAASLKKDFDTFCVLGIGGSSLGAQAVIEALAPQDLENKKVLFFDNVDAKSFFRKIHGLKDVSRTLWVLVSKSGGTVETLAQADFLEQFLWEKHSLHLHQKSVVVTEFKSSPLRNWAQTHKVAQLEVPLSVGGRFSVLTPVGTFLFHLLGLNVAQMLKGAESAIAQREELSKTISQFAMSLSRQESTTYFLSYCDDLKYWGQWLQQLWAESLGKKVTNDGSTAPAMSVPYACRGATDQHSVLQQISEGTQKKMVCFLRVKESESFGPVLKEQILLTEDPLQGKNLGQLLSAEASAIQQALNEAGVATLTLQTEKLDEESLGYLLMTFQLAVATLGLMNNIDPFNQPGVERGKVLTRLILSNSLKFS